MMKKSPYPIANSKYIHKLNTIKILNLVRSSEPVSRAELVKDCGLSAPTVSRIVESLIEDGLVRETGAGKSSGGRRPTLLEFSGHDNCIIGIDLGTTQILGVLSDLNANIISEVSRPTHVKEGFNKVMQRTSAVISELESQLNGNSRRICGIGMAVAGLINRQRKIVEFSPDFHWHEVDVIGELSQWHDLPIIFDNVTRVMALGELWYGVGKQLKNFICINVGYGVGAGIVIEGKPFYGPTGMSGEFGHTTLEKESDVQCDCGNFGCLEALASGNAIAKFARLELENNRRSILADLCSHDSSQITAEMVANAAKQGDPVAYNVFDRAMEYLGIGIANLINIFGPEAVVIGGGVAQAGDILFDKVRKTVSARSLKKIAKDIQIVPATFGKKASVMGAVSLIANDVFNLDHINCVHLNNHKNLS
jgi:glucokinase-like ROK family protein